MGQLASLGENRGLAAGLQLLLPISGLRQPWSEERVQSQPLQVTTTSSRNHWKAQVPGTPATSGWYILKLCPYARGTKVWKVGVGRGPDGPSEFSPDNQSSQEEEGQFCFRKTKSQGMTMCPQGQQRTADCWQQTSSVYTVTPSLELGLGNRQLSSFIMTLP